MKRRDHPDFFDIDLPRIEGSIGSVAAFGEFFECLDGAVEDIKRDPINAGAPLQRPPLDTYRKVKFHSTRRPPQGVRADMRLVYRYDAASNTLFILGVGERIPRDVKDVYRVLNIRPPF